MQDVADLSFICNILVLFAVLLAVQRPQIAPMQGLCQTAEKDAAFAATLNGNLFKVLIYILAFAPRLDSFFDVVQVVRVLFYGGVDLSAQDDIAVALDNVLQPHFSDLFDGGEHVVWVTVYDVGERHEGVTGEEYAVFLHQNGDAVVAVTECGRDDEILFPDAHSHFTGGKRDVGRNDLDLPQVGILLAGSL